MPFCGTMNRVVVLMLHRGEVIMLLETLSDTVDCWILILKEAHLLGGGVLFLSGWIDVGLL